MKILRKKEEKVINVLKNFRYKELTIQLKYKLGLRFHYI